MLVVNAVGCTLDNNCLQSIIDSAVDENYSSILTDSEKVYNYIENKHNNKIKIIQEENLFILLARAITNSILLITNIDNYISDEYKDLSKEYDIIEIR